MSLKSTSYVLDRQFGSHIRKLLMLCIADFANDSGEAWPSIDTLAYRAECSRRTVQENLIVLQQSGELAVHQNAGPRGCNLYRIIFKEFTLESENFIPRKPRGKQGGAAPAPVQMSAAQTAGGGADERRPNAPEPLGTVIEPSEREKTHSRDGSAVSLTQDELCDLIDRVNTCRPEWQAAPALTAKEGKALRENLPALVVIQPDTWETIAAYLKAKIEEGRPAYQPRSREKLITDISDVITHAIGWKRRQRPPTPKKPQPEQPTEPALTIEEQFAILRAKP